MTIELNKIHTALIVFGILVVGAWNVFQFYHNTNQSTESIRKLSQTVDSLSSSVQKMSNTINEQSMTIGGLQAIVSQQRDTAELETYIKRRKRGDSLNPLEKNEYCKLLMKYRGITCDV